MFCDVIEVIASTSLICGKHLLKQDVDAAVGVVRSSCWSYVGKEGGSRGSRRHIFLREQKKSLCCIRVPAIVHA